MAGGQVKKIWEKLLSPFKQVDKRHLQHEIDTYRLFLLTSYNRLGASGGEEVAKEVQSLAERTVFAAQQAEVQDNVHQQISSVANMLDGVLLKPVKSEDSIKKKRPSGLSFAVGQAPPKVIREQAVETNPLSRAEVSRAFYERFGFTLETKQSEIDHQEAGEGLFLSGRVEAGTVVSFYPGVIYTPSQYRYMPGYPRVDIGNPYLIARYDGLILDGKSWGRGGDTREWWEGYNSHELDPLNPPTNNLPDDSKVNDGRQRIWESVTGAQKLDVPIKGAVMERRNPLALGQFANHPPKDKKPNVMICSYSAPVNEDFVRPYVPNIVLELEEHKMERRGLLWVKEGRSEDDDPSEAKPEIRTLVLVATRALENEELLLNYRLSSYMKRPLWYSAVDEEEDRRRWE